MPRALFPAAPRDFASRFLHRLPALVAVLALVAAGVPLPREAAAQPPLPTLDVRVTTDRQQYEVGEPVKVLVNVVNLLPTVQELRFRSGCMATYGFEGEPYIHDQPCTANLPTLTLQPNENHVFPAFVHTAEAYPLGPGRHAVWGEVIGYGRASARFVVGVPDSLPGPVWRLAPRIAPNPARVGDSILFSLAVTNGSNTTQSFVVDGCPVRFTIDGNWEPQLACIEIARQISLKAGETIAFSATDYPYLQYTPGVNGAPLLPPGEHVVSLRVQGVGAIRAPFAVEDSMPPGGGAITGTVADESGQLVAGISVSAMTYYPATDSLPPPPGRGGDDSSGGVDPTRPGFYAQAFTGPDGHYRIAGVPAGRYVLWATGRDGTATWYNNVPYADQATPVTVPADGVVEGIDFILKPGPPPPPPLPGVIEGNVMTWVPEGSRAASRPIPGAVILALFEGSPRDTVVWPPDDPATGPGRPVEPPDWWGQQRFYGLADSTGQYRIQVPFGNFRLVAGEFAHRYQWWRGADTFEGSRDLIVGPDQPTASASFALKPLGDPALVATLGGTVHALARNDDTGGGPGGGGDTGGGTGDDDADGRDPNGPPIDDTLRRPLEGAQVSAMPLLEDPRLMRPTQVRMATTDEAGRFSLDVPANSPYILQAFAEGHMGQFYDHVGDYWSATPVDVAPGARTDSLDFDLRPDFLPVDGGMLSGQVMTPETGPIDAAGIPAPLPAGHALVRIRAANPGFGPFEVVTRTDARGYWMVYGLPTASDGSLKYIVSAEAEGYVPTYHPAAHRASEALPVQPLPPYFDAIATADITLEPQTTDGAWFVAGRVRGAANRGGETAPPMPPMPPDSLDGDFYPLIGAFVYLVSVEAATNAGRVVAGGVACGNGTLVITGLPAGHYRAYADRPGYAPQWFGGTSAGSATVFQLGEGASAPLLDFTLRPLDPSEPPPPGEGDTDASLDTPMTNLRNAPNPSKPQTTIMYRLNTAAEVSVHVFDVNGRLVRTLFDRSLQSPGEQRVVWDGRDDEGQVVGAGMYFYQVQTARTSATGKMVIVR